MRKFMTLWQAIASGKKRRVLTGAALCAIVLAVPSAAQQRGDDRTQRCQDLERQLVSDWQRSNSPQEAVGRLDQQLDDLQRNRRTAEAEAERRNCYEDMFLFGRSLRRTRDCVQLDSDIENFRRNITTLRQQRDAMTNDAEREEVFVNQMRGLLTGDDVVLAISVHGGSGFSADLVRAVRFANEIGARTIALVGFDGGVLHRECTCSILVPVDSTPQTEAIHLVIEHLLMHLLKRDLLAISPV